jgi:hypothetical protein
MEVLRLAATGRLRRLREKFGKVLNIHGEMAHAPVVLAAYTGRRQRISGSHGRVAPPRP